ncbi:WD40 repeat protein [Ostreococcus tauri]|uniref:WD40 repeat protein n=1 Tax=Ostreococcus tauri TaxID=70448 RepID=A0A1Y5IBF7_OSTTA|nr:WD40 repeat protein [Ostreococcus tauri]
MAETRARTRGTVTWFNCVRGYGYVRPHDGSEDVFVHQSELQMDGFRSVWEGDEIEFELDDDERRRAKNVTGPAGAPLKKTPKQFYRRVRKDGNEQSRRHQDAPPWEGAIGKIAHGDARDAAAATTSATWRESAPRDDRSAGTTWEEGVYNNMNEAVRFETLLATTSAGGEVFVSRCWRTTRTRERGGVEVMRAIRLDDGELATCVASDEDNIVVGTDRGRVVFLSWARGEEGTSATCRRTERDGAAASVSWCADTGTIVMRFDTGSVCAMRMNDQGEIVSRNWFEAFPEPAVFAAFHRGTGKLALGAMDGEVRVYDDALTADASRPKMIFRLSAWGFTSEDTGAAAFGSWSHDGKALAVAWRRRGLAIWSDSGCLLMCTLHHHGRAEGAVVPRKSFVDIDETPEVGACLGTPAWGILGYSLYVVVNGYEGTHVEEYSLARSCPKPCVPPRASEHATGDESSLLIGDDRVFVIASNAMGKFCMRQEICPTEYVESQWPMRVAAMSPDGTRVAVAGSRGCVVYDTDFEEWIMHPELEHKIATEVIDFTWVCPAREVSGRCASILALVSCVGKPRVFGTKLTYAVNFISDGGAGAQIATLPLPSQPTHACSCGEYFAVSFANSELAIYEVKSSEEGVVSAHPVRESNGQRRRVTLENGTRVSGFCLVRMASSASSDDTVQAPSECVVLTNANEVIVVDLTGDYKSVKILEDVKEFWVSDCSVSNQNGFVSDGDSGTSSSDELPTDRGCIFAYGSYGMRICYFPKDGLREIFTRGSTLCDVETASNNPELEFDRESYPLAVSLKLNRIIGAKQKLSFADSYETPYFLISPSVHTVVPYVLRKLLGMEQFTTALRYARAARRQTPHFAHALEWLLFTAVENAGRDITSQKVLKQSVALLAELPNYLDIIVSVARKTENTRWDCLFKYAGSPSDLCAKAMKANQVRVAACYILVVDKLEGEVMGREIALRVMESALEAHDYKLVEDLIKFLLKPVDGSQLSRQGDRKGLFRRVLNVVVPPPRSVTDYSNKTDPFALDDREQALLKSHLDVLARAKDVVSMGAFIADTSFDGVSYMMHEAEEPGEAFIADFYEAIRCAVQCLRDRKSRNNKTKSPRASASALIDATFEAGSKSDEMYVAALLDVTRTAQCTDWSLLIATVLGRGDVLADYFEKEPALRDPWLGIARRFRDESNDAHSVRHFSTIIHDIERLSTGAA